MTEHSRRDTLMIAALGAVGAAAALTPNAEAIAPTGDAVLDVIARTSPGSSAAGTCNTIALKSACSTITNGRISLARANSGSR
jgi:hypothetical protein